jgi:DNA-binding transcriptional MerR regulator
MVVVLPAPFGPSSATTSPRSIRRSRPWSTSAVPYRIRSPRVSMTGSPGGAGGMPSVVGGIHTFKFLIEVQVGTFSALAALVQRFHAANLQLPGECARGGWAVGDEARLRPVDLARLAGVSTQQIRNYADAGVLPAAPRTDAGYRVFTAGHRRALLTYQALANGYGTMPARAIMQAVHAGDTPRALMLVDTAHAGLHEQRRSLREVGEALETVARQDPETSELPRSRMRIGEVAAYLGVRTSALRVWEAAGLLTPERAPGTGYRHFGPADVRDARMINMLRLGRYPLPRIGAILDGLRRAGGSEALRAAIAERQESLNRRTTAMLEGAGRLHDYLTSHPA